MASNEEDDVGKGISRPTFTSMPLHALHRSAADHSDVRDDSRAMPVEEKIQSLVSQQRAAAVASKEEEQSMEKLANTLIMDRFMKDRNDGISYRISFGRQESRQCKNDEAAKESSSPSYSARLSR